MSGRVIGEYLELTKPRITLLHSDERGDRLSVAPNTWWAASGGWFCSTR